MTSETAQTDAAEAADLPAAHAPAPIELTKVYGAARAYLVQCDRDGTGKLSSEHARAVLDPVRGLGATALIRLVPTHVLRRSGAAWFVEATAPTGREAVVSSRAPRAAPAHLPARGA